MTENKPIAILCSGVALGVYNPALILKKRLERLGRTCRVHVLEKLHNSQRRENILVAKKAFHRNFSLACNSQKMAANIADTFEPELVEGLLEQWEKDSIETLCVFSGFWMPVIKLYRERLTERHCNVHLCYMDAVPSASWKPFVNELTDCHEHRLFDLNCKKVTCQLVISEVETSVAGKRENRYVVHGGGWGMGTYRKAIEELGLKQMSMDIICYEDNDIKNSGTTVRSFMIDPQWKPWEQVCGDYIFPPFAEIREGTVTEFKIPEKHPDVYDLASNAMGIISKPGGATLLDSFASATPLIFLPETFGEYEKKNSELWEMLGFGVDFNAWRASGYSTDMLLELHQNILQYKEKECIPMLEEEIVNAT